jgi:alpha,alpha-trehalase
LWLITKNAVEYNGTIPEKFDLEISSHSFLLNMEMWGQNLIISQRRFGWVNASYQIGLQIIDLSMKKKLNQLVSPENYFFS